MFLQKTFQKLFALALVCSFVLILSGAKEHGSSGKSGQATDLSIIIGRPTDHAVTLSVLSAAGREACVEYSATPNGTAHRTEPLALKANTPTEIEIANLDPNTRYTYRLLSRSPGKGDFTPSEEGAFQTQRPAGQAFTFGVQGDSHPEREGKMFTPGLYTRTLDNVARENPDFYIMMGDDFSIERLIADHSLSQPAVDAVYAHQRTFLDAIARQSALFLVNGNHEQTAKANLDGTGRDPAVLAGNARTHFFPLPAPNNFYTGDTEPVTGVGLLRDYYAWTWGDALFVVIDPYWHSAVTVDNEAGARQHGGETNYDQGEKDGQHGKRGKSGGGGKNRDLWGITLGDTQYQWLVKTLTESKAHWKFVFTHHVLGTGRGGIECAPFFEWGGRDRGSSATFAEKRPGWPLPIHQLMAKTGVTIFFQGHDHLYARQELDGVIYQSCPIPADPTYTAFNRDAYRSGVVLPNSRHLRVTVSPEKVQVDYVSSYLPGDEQGGRKNGAIAYSYTISAKNTGASQ